MSQRTVAAVDIFTGLIAFTILLGIGVAYGDVMSTTKQWMLFGGMVLSLCLLLAGLVIAESLDKKSKF